MSESHGVPETDAIEGTFDAAAALAVGCVREDQQGGNCEDCIAEDEAAGDGAGLDRCPNCAVRHLLPFARAQLTALKARVAELEQVKTALRGQTDCSIALQRLISDLLRAAKGEPWNPRTTYKDAPHMRSMADEVAKAIASLRSPGEEGTNATD